MRKHTHALTGLLGLILASAAVAAVHFEHDRPDDGHRHAGLAIAGVTTTLAQAVTAAEQAVPQGRAVHADFERDPLERWRFLLTVWAPQGTFDVVVDPTTGKALSVAAARDGHD